MLELDVKCDWWVMTPNTHHNLFLISHLCILTSIHVTWKLQVIYERSAHQTTALLWVTFLVCCRVAWEIQLESYRPRHTSVVSWYNIVCVYCKCIHASLFGAQIHMGTKLTYLMTAHYTPNVGLLPARHHFIRTKLASHSTPGSVLSINSVC